MIQTWKIIHLKGFKCSQFFTLVRCTRQMHVNGTRFNTDPLNIVQQRQPQSGGRTFFSLRVVEHCNALPTTRAGEPANFLAAPAPDFFSSGSGSGSCSWYFFFRAAPAPAPRGQQHLAPTSLGSLAKYSFPAN